MVFGRYQMRRKRILYIESNRDGTVGGSYYCLLNLVEGLDKTEFEPFLLFCQDNFLLREFRKITPNVHVRDLNLSHSAPIRGAGEFLKYPYRFLTRVLLKQKELMRVIDEIGPEIVHLNNSYAIATEMILACRIMGVKIIAHDRGAEYPCSTQAKLFGGWLDAIISVSNHCRNNVVKQGIKARRIVRIYDGINNRCKDSACDQSYDVRCEVGAAPGDPLVGIVGNIMKWKGQEVVLRAIHEVKKVQPGIKCLIVGKVAERYEKYYEKLKKYVQDNKLDDNVIFLGYRRDVPEIIRQLDILLHASLEPEPFGLVVLEGMSQGKAVVATNAGGPAEIVLDHETGILVEPGNSDQMAEAIISLIANKDMACSMGEKGKKRLLETFTTEKMIEETERLYKAVLGFDPESKQLWRL